MIRLRRRHILAITAVPGPALDSLLFKDLQPWDEPPLLGDDERRSGYTVEQAFRLLIAAELTGGYWLPGKLPDAGRLIRSTWPAIRARASGLSNTDRVTDLWLGSTRHTDAAALIASGEADDALLRAGIEPAFLGTLTELMAVVAGTDPTRGDAQDAAAFTAVNLSRCWRLLRARATACGVSIPADPAAFLEPAP